RFPHRTIYWFVRTNIRFQKIIKVSRSIHADFEEYLRMASKRKFRSFCIAAISAGLISLCGCVGVPKTASDTVTPINHIIFMVQENRSFDSYFSQLPAYWAANGYPSQQVDVPPNGASNPGFAGAPNVTSFHLATDCIENLSPSW